MIDDPLQLPERFLECSIRFTKIELQEVAHQMAEGELRRRLEATLKSKDWETNGEAIRAAIVNSQLSASARLVVGSHLRIR